ncbi:MAG: hypothetical protein SCJ94_11905 [Bacillota bacterium]|nr:hypothetical protein [Bacillota bacterium]
MFIKNKLHNRLNKILLQADTLRSQAKDELQKGNEMFNRGEISDVTQLRYHKGQYLHAVNEQMAELRRGFFNELDKIKEELQTAAFAPSASDRREFRDVYSQLMDVTDKDKLQRHYDNAIRFNDTPALKAVAARAADLGATDILNDYGKRDAAFAEHAESYSEFAQSARDLNNKMAAKMRLTNIIEPQLKSEERIFGHSTDSQGNQVAVYRPVFYYEDHDKQAEEPDQDDE